MSQITNVITTQFRAVGGNVVAQLGSYASGFGRLGSQIQQNVSMSERLNNQWRAMGTTIRYAIAGSAVFGLTRMIGQLKDVNTQLGLMAAIGSGPSGQPFTYNQVTQLGQQLQSTAVNAITPINQVNDAAVNFLSTVQNVPPSQIPDILTNIGQAATLAQTPIEDLTQAATTMNIAFGRANNLTNISQFNRMWYALISTAPGGITAAPSIAQGLPGLASMFQLAPGKVSPKLGQAQMMALTLGVLRTGMPASTALRGLTYLAQSVAQPTGGAKTALAGIGITPQYVQQHGVYSAIMKLLHQIAPVSMSRAKQLGALDLDTMGDSANLPGIPAQEMLRLRQMIPRIHGVRAAIILASQLQARAGVTSIEQNLRDMGAAEDNHAKAAQDMAKAWKRFAQRNNLQQASIAINQMGLQVAQTFAPILGFAANRITGLSSAMRHHPTATHWATIGVAAALGLGVGSRVLTGRGVLGNLGRLPGPIGRMLGRIGFGGAGQGITRAIAAQDLLAGTGGGRGSSPAMPLYVTVVGQLFGGNAPGDSTIPSGPGGGTTGGSGGGIWGFAKRVGGWGLAGGKAIWNLRRLPMKTPAAAGALAQLLLQYGAETPALGDFFKYLTQGIDPTTGRNVGHSFGWRLLPWHGDKQFRSWQDYHRTLQRVNRMHIPGVGQVTNIDAMSRGFLAGRAEVFLTIDQKDPTTGRISRKKVHVPVNLWQGGRNPGSRGQAGAGTRH